MTGWGGLGGYLEDLQDRRQRAGDPNDTSPAANFTRRACDAVARSGLPPALAPHAHYACGPYWDDAPYDPPADPIPPFEGGQCPGVLYDVSLSYGSDNTNPIDTVFTNQLGPVNFRVESDSGFNTYYLTSAGNDGPLVVSLLTDENPFFSITGVSRVDGQPDNCGDPTTPDRDPVVLPPGTLPPNGNPVDISDPNDPDDTTPPVRFSPNPPSEYEPFVPIIPEFPGAPPFAFPPGAGDDIPPRAGDPVDVPSGGTGDTDVETPDDELPDECIGYSWEFYDIPLNRGGIPGASPKRFYEIFGSAQLRVSGQDVGLYDAPVKIDSERGVCYRSDRNLRVRGLSLNSKASYGPVRVRPVYVVVKEN